MAKSLLQFSKINDSLFNKRMPEKRDTILEKIKYDS